ncbi:helix-turn-helix transcriptional regulator [Herbiconiux sp. CPCC 203386]|uniref:Helix-turn-helix transcriptional regulator n=2 Tax=Herbiconiux daphne TaxID=2970914 RepID=A0ABT2H4C4_9MICO|nr:helix-turn-helix transcriptional regulator [Herbiconiux daphne]
MRAYALTRLGDTQKASLVLDLIDDRVLGHHKLYRYTALSVEASLNAASGDVRQGVELLNETIEHLGPSNETIVAAYEQARLTTYTEALRAGADSIRGRDLTPGFPHRDRHTAPADRTGGSPAPTETIDAVDELSEREYEIALLVAEQLSNKEIARRLFLSVRTVESHVYTARGKVGARTRRELGRVVADAEVARER